MTTGKSCMNSVSRRTRSGWDAFYKNLHYEAKKKRCGGEQEEKNKGLYSTGKLNKKVKDVYKEDNGQEDNVVFDGNENNAAVGSTVNGTDDSSSSDTLTWSSEESDLSDDPKDGNYGARSNKGKKGARSEEHRVEKGFRENDADVVILDDSESSKGNSEEESDDNSDDNNYRPIHKSLSKRKRVTGKVGRPSKKRAVVTEKRNVIHMLVDNIWKEKDLENDMRLASDEDKHVVETTLPLKFRFEDDEESLVVEKTEWEKELDSLFNDLEMSLWESEVGSCTETLMTEAEHSASTQIDESPVANCERGQHDTILDEEIGIICRICLTVILEIKYVLPPFIEKLHKKHDGEYYKRSEDSIFDKIPVQDAERGSIESFYYQSKGTVLDLIPHSGKELYPHQLDGFQFLWRNIAGDVHIGKLKTLPSTGGRGCIISHAPGTGKSRLTIVFLQTFMKLYPNSRPVIIAPRGMLLTWEQEFKKWKVDMNFINLNEKKLSSHETAMFSSVGSCTRGQENNINFVRMVKLYAWMKGKSVLGIGYRLFEELAGKNGRKNLSSNTEFKKILLELPGLVVMDEGHTPRNDQSLMWKALTQVSTKRRVILSGTPFQNNFTELYNTLTLVNPRFCSVIMGKGSKRRGRKRKNSESGRDEWIDLSNSIIKNDKEGIKKLRCLMEPFLHVHKGGILEKTLPGLRDCLILLKPTDLQSKLLQNINPADNFLEQVHLASLISVHPSLAVDKPEFSSYNKKLKLMELDPNAGVKTRFLIKLIQLADRLNEKVLIFSQFIDPLLHIKKLLKHQFKWNEGQEMTYMDGDIGLQQRQCAINAFNEKGGKARVMLASQRACSEGINLVGASRVVLLDVVWNPSVERQAISRAYRLGQEKVVYVYHLVTLMEVKKYDRQAKKERIANVLFDPENWVSNGTCDDRNSHNNKHVCEDKVLEAIVRHQGLGSMIDRIVHQPKESDLVDDASWF